MKKVLSVLLAAAMVMGMSVSVFADHSWKPAGGTNVPAPVSEVLDFENKVVVERDQIDGWNKDYKIFNEGDELALEPGDNLYFPLLTAGTREVLDCTYTHEHKDGCYEWVCTKIHQHTADCYKPEKELTCKHKCDDNCISRSETVECKHQHCWWDCYKLDCHNAMHIFYHDESCYKLDCKHECTIDSGCVTPVEIVSCMHAHDENCYTVKNGEPVCNTEEHVCTDDKKDCTLMKGNLICGEDVKDHEHDEDCYKVVGTKVNYTGDIDPNWSINIKGNVYVDGASYYSAVKNTTTDKYETAWGEEFTAPYKYVKVEIADDLDATSTKTVKFELYIADEDYKNCETEHVIVEAKFANVKEAINKVDFNHTNDADEAAVWEVAKGAKGTATFDFDSVAYFTVKMVPEEKVTLNLSVAYDKAIDKLFDYEADLEFYNFKGTKDAFTKVGELFIPADEDTFIYEVVDGKLVEVEATWTDEYTITDVTKEYEGWVIETNELGYYVVSDVEAEIEAEAEVEAPVKSDKANPETGAADFVGAAVAMAVVSVAAAGALALKK